MLHLVDDAVVGMLDWASLVGALRAGFEKGSGKPLAA